MALTLSAAEVATLRAVCDRIIPRDEDPGATDLGADIYVLRQLAGDCAQWLGAIQQGLAQANVLARHRGVDFAALTPGQQDELLEALSGEAWFNELIDLTAEGYYANPGNGGNRDALSWRMIGYRHGLPDGPDGPGRPEPGADPS